MKVLKWNFESLFRKFDLNIRSHKTDFTAYGLQKDQPSAWEWTWENKTRIYYFSSFKYVINTWDVPFWSGLFVNWCGIWHVREKPLRLTTKKLKFQDLNFGCSTSAWPQKKFCMFLLISQLPAFFSSLNSNIDILRYLKNSFFYSFEIKIRAEILDLSN